MSVAAGCKRNADREHRHKCGDEAAATLAPERVGTSLTAAVACAPQRARPLFSSLTAGHPHLPFSFPRPRAGRMSSPSATSGHARRRENQAEPTRRRRVPTSPGRGRTGQSSLERGSRPVASRRGPARPPHRGDPARPRCRPPLAFERRRGRDDGAREAALEARSWGGRPTGGQAERRRGADFRDEREDDDLGDGGPDSGAVVSARAQPVRREPGLGSRLGAPRRPGRRARVVRGGRGGAARGCPSPAASCALSRQPLPGPTRPLRRARARRGPLAEGGRGPAGRRRSGGECRRSASRVAGERAAGRDVRARRPALRLGRPSARRRLEMVRPVWYALHVRGGLHRASRRLPLPGMRSRSAGAGRGRAADRAEGARVGLIRSGDAGRKPAGRAGRAGPLQRLQRARGRIPGTCARL